LSWTLGSAALEPNPDLKPILVPSATPKRKHSMLPVLVVLFVLSYGLMTMLIVEQGRTIESQRSLIHSLFSDSSELSHLKSQAAQKQRATAQAQAEAKPHSQVQTPSTQDKARAGKDPGKLRQPAPPKLPKDGFTLQDVRRSVVSI
jgi:hypothetical protein